jgi:hypothetical protein
VLDRLRPVVRVAMPRLALDMLRPFP